MPTYKLKEAAREYNLVDIPFGGTIGDFLYDLSDGGLPNFWSFTFDECATREAGDKLDRAVDYLVSVFGVSVEEAKKSILGFFQFGVERYTDDVKKIPNFFLLSCDTVFPEVWRLRKMNPISIPGPETQLSDLAIYAYNGASHNDEVFLLFEDVSRAAIEVLGDDTPETWGELRELGTDILFEVLKTLLDLGPTDFDIRPGKIPQCGEVAGVPFTQNEDSLYFPGVVLLSLNDLGDKIIGLLFKTDEVEPHESEEYGFAGTISVVGAGSGVIDSGDGITRGMYKTVCDSDLDAIHDLDPETNGLTLEEAYNNDVLRPYIEMIPDPEPEPVGLQATKRNSIRVF